jgi:pimeloyl-ACP methyl ester carboxylesterase
MPVLIVSGEHDFLCPRMTARRLKELIPASHWLELASVGHAVPIECHRDLSMAIREVLAGRFSAEAAGNLGRQR